MEVLGILSAIPALVELVTGTTKLVRACASKTNLAKATKGLEVQLNLLGEILAGIDKRWKARTLSSDQLIWLGPVVKELREELASLNSLLAKASTPNHELGFVGRAILALRGFETQVHRHIQRIENIKTLLIFKIADGIDAVISKETSVHRFSHRLQIKGILQPCTVDFIPTKLDGTFEWIWSQPAVSNWVNHSSSSFADRVLCIYGVKGCGKSVLASSIADDFKARDEVSAFFAFWAQSESQKKITHMLATILWLLLKKLSEDQFDVITCKIMQNQPLTSHALLDGIDESLRLIKKPVYIVIDGVDESTDEWGDVAAGGISLVMTLVKTHSNIRLLLLGREAILREALKQFPSLMITQELVKGDMARMISEELKFSTNIQTDEMRSHVQSILEEKAAGMFLWVRMIFQELRRCFSAAEIKATLESLPQDLDDEYHRVFVRLIRRLGGTPGSDNPSLPMRRAKGLLEIIIGAAEPLTLDELRHAYAVATHPTVGWEEHLLLDDGIIDACGDFVQISANRIHLGHSSIEEFLTRPADGCQAYDDIKFFRIDPVQNQGLLGMTCLNYFQILDWGYPLHDDSFIRLSQDWPFLLYAHKYAMFHVFQGGTSEPTMPSKVKAFLHSRQFCKWIEYTALHAIHDFTFADYMIDLAQFSDWYTAESGGNEPLLQLVARRLSEETTHRQLVYGLDDPRTQSWELIGSLANIWMIVKPDKANPILGAVDSLAQLDQRSHYSCAQISSPETVGVTSDQVTRLPGKILSPDIVAQQLKSIAATSPNFSAARYTMLVLRGSIALSLFKIRLDPLEVLSSMITAACARLPILLVVVIAGLHYSSGKIEKAMEICSIAVKRAENKKNFEESAALSLMGDLLAEQGNLVMAEKCYRTGMEIMQTFPRKIHNDFLTVAVTIPLISVLAAQNRNPEGLELGQQLIESISNSGCNSKLGGKWERYARNTKPWAELQMRVFKDLCRIYDSMGYHNEAVIVADQAVACLQTLLGPANSLILAIKSRQAGILSKLGRYSEAAERWEEVAKDLGLKNEEAFSAQWGRARALTNLQRYEEVENFLREVEELYPTSCARGWRIAHNLADILQHQGKSMDARKEIDKLDFTKEVPDLLDREFVESFKLFYKVNWLTSNAHGTPASFESWLLENIARDGNQGGQISLKNISGIINALHTEASRVRALLVDQV